MSRTEEVCDRARSGLNTSFGASARVGDGNGGGRSADGTQRPGILRADCCEPGREERVEVRVGTRIELGRFARRDVDISSPVPEVLGRSCVSLGA